MHHYSNQTEYLIAIRDRGHDPRVLDYAFYGLPPFDHQVRMFEWGRRRKTMAFLSEQGTGKTRSALDVCQYRLETNRIKNILVVCPLSVISSWQDEIKTWCKPGLNRHTVLVGTKEQRKQKLENGMMTGVQFFIINYDGVRTIEQALQRHKWGMIILDESIMIKNRQAQRTKAIKRVAANTEYKLIMTGSPITQDALDLHSQFEFLDGGRTLGKNYFQFRNRFFQEINFGQFSKWVPRKGSPPEIQRMVYTSAIRYTKEQCLDLPEKIFQQRYVSMTAKQAKMYKDMSDQLIAEIEDGEYTSAALVVTKLIRLSQITAGVVTPDNSEEARRINAQGKDPKNSEIIQLIEQSDDQFVIWCRFRKEIMMVVEDLRKKGYEVGYIYGDVKQADRARAIDDWRAARTRVLVCQVATAGMGITLLPRDPGVGITVIYRSNDYSLNNRLQSQDRTHRIGLKRSVSYIDLVVPKTVDVAVFNAIASKKDLADRVIERDVASIIRGEM